MPKNTEIVRIEEVAESVKVFGKVPVQDKKCGPTPTTLLVLCECREVVDPTCCPMDLRTTDGEETWMILMVVERDSTTAAPFGFADKLSKFLRDEGMSMTDLFPPLSSNHGSPVSIIRAVDEILEKTARPQIDTNAYRHLHTFSGTIPTPAGEETMDQWIEQAKMMITECECSEKEKRRRIVESLKGPALEIIKAVRVSSPDANALQYLEVLESTFS